MGGCLGDEGYLLSIHCLAAGTEYFIKVPRVKLACILSDNTVSGTRNIVGQELKSISIDYYKHVN